MKIVRILAVICLPMLMVACGQPSDKETQANVDTANLAITHMNNIDAQLRTQGIYLALPDMSKTAVRSMSRDQLITVQAELNSYIANGRIVRNASSQPNVSYSDRDKVATYMNAAGDILNTVNDQIKTGTTTDKK